MNLCEFTILNIIFIFFPLLLYLVYIVYTTSFNKKENDLLLEFSLLSALYLTIRYSGINNNMPILVINAPLLIAYIKKRPIGIFLSSLLLIYYYGNYFNNFSLLLIIEYSIYLILFIIKEKKEWSNKTYIDIFLILKSILFGYYFLHTNYKYILTSFILIEALLMMFLLTIVTYAIILLFQEGEKLLKLHMTFKELEKEKQIQMSLFQITHEIKNPIAVCKGYLDMFDINNPEHSKKYIPIIKEEIARTLILLQDFLSIQKMKIEKDILDVNLLLEEIIISLEPLFKEKKNRSKLKY